MGRALLHRRLTGPRAMAISAVIAALCTFWSAYSVSLLPPGVTSRQLEIGAAATHVVLDRPESLFADKRAGTLEFETDQRRAVFFGTLLTSAPVGELIAAKIGVPPERITARARLTSGVQWAMRDPDYEQRGNQILVEKGRYRIEVQADPGLPILHVYTQAPSAATAVRLADASIESLREYLTTRAAREGRDPREQMKLVQLAKARGGVINGSTVPQLVLLTFLVSFGISWALLLGIPRVRRGWTEARRGRVAETEPLPRRTARGAVDPGGAWPHTTRVLPWMIAVFMVVLWLVPFNGIQLSASLPIDLKFDRLVLPLVFGIWVLALAAGGPGAPRLRLTPIHVGIGLFVAVTCLGVVLGMPTLNQLLEFDLSAKKLTLLLSYGLLFMIIASSVRRVEVPAFLKLALALSIICALGTIWEYRFHYNVFYDLSARLLPGIFQVGAVDSTQVDEIGRAMTRGPADHPLETVGMLSMAMPIALVGVITSPDRRRRLWYALAACVLLAAAISTYRKSALLGPLAVVLTIAYYRRRDLLKLAPLGVISLIVIHGLSPGALGSILFQLDPTRLGVSTVSDRTADYDAIRPDLWNHLVFGRGYGSYDHLSYRILDSEMLSRLVDTGVLGVVCFVVMLGSIIYAARRLIRSHDPVWSSTALAVAAAAVAYLVLAFLFDVSSFPHVPYILFSLAGLLAVASADDRTDEPEHPPAPLERHGGRTHAPGGTGTRRTPRRVEA